MISAFVTAAAAFVLALADFAALEDRRWHFQEANRYDRQVEISVDQENIASIDMDLHQGR